MEKQEPIYQKEPIKISEIGLEVKERLSTIAKIIGGDFGMKIEIGKPRGGSYFTPEENKITFDPLEIQENELNAEFVAAHEGGHKAISRIAPQLGLKPEKIKELYSQIGFDFMQRMIEEPAVNTWIEEKYAGLEEAISKQKKHTAEMEGSFVVDPEVVRVFKILGRIPKFAKWATEIQRYWAGVKPSQNLDDNIKKILEATIDSAKKSYKTLPSKTPKEKEIIEKARQRFLINYKEVWPIFQKLVEQDISQEEINEMLREMLKKEFQQIKEDMENKPLPGPLGKLPEDLQKELREKIKQAIEEMEKFMEKKEKAGEEKEEGETTEEEKKSPLPIPEFSKELQEKLREIFENLPEREKYRLKEKAIEILEKVDDKLNKAVKPKLQEDKTPSHQEIKSMKIPEKTEEKPEEELEKIRRKLKEETESLMSEYDKYYREVAPLIEDLYNRLEKIFLPERYPKWKKKQPSGTRLDLLEAMQFEQDPSKYTRLWETKTVPQKIDYRFMFLVDLSNSMRYGGKIQETFKGLILLTETLNRLDIKVEIMGFSAGGKFIPNLYKIYKNYDENLSQETRNKIGEILTECDGNTPTAEVTKEASKRLENFSSKNNFLITLTDGEPYSDKIPLFKYRNITKEIIAGIRQKTNQKLIGIGLGPDTEMVREYYPASLSVKDVNQLPETLSQLLENVIRNPQKYQ